MKRLWELIINAQGADRFYCFPFLLFFRVITPLYQAISRRQLARREKHRSREWKAKVISVGSITVGGSGKTPIVMELAGWHSERGFKVAVVHSGYGRDSKENIFVEAGRRSDFSLSQLGDEAGMMAEVLPEVAFAIGPDKKEMVRSADKRFSPDVIIIDDGFQRRDIVKDFDIALLDLSALKNFRRLRPFPAGILREPYGSLSRADILFLIDYNDGVGDGDYLKHLGVSIPDEKICTWSFAIDSITGMGKDIEISDLQDEKPFLFAGIGSFDRLLAMISLAGLELAGYYRFSDHYDYDKLDVDHLRGMAEETGAGCYLTTAKDMVKLAHLSFDRPLYRLNLKVGPVDRARLDRILGLEAR